MMPINFTMQYVWWVQCKHILKDSTTTNLYHYTKETEFEKRGTPLLALQNTSDKKKPNIFIHTVRER